MRYRLALTLLGWAIKLGGPVFVLAIRQAVISQLLAEQAQQCQQAERALAQHQAMVAERAARQ